MAPVPVRYLALARIDHWIKNVFVLPGIFLGVLYVGVPTWRTLLTLSLALLSACLISSANYTINEWIDRHSDRFHPLKKLRPCVHANLQGSVVYLQYVALIVAGLGIAWTINVSFFLTSAFLLMMGIVYNVPPLRTKDIAYLDVISESLNNPIRLLLGWFAFVPDKVPSGSLLVAYWFGGAFLMAVKRYSEYRYIADAQLAGSYRRSFRYYDEQKLLLSSVFYAMSSSMFLGIFLVRYRMELVISFPFYAFLFIWYLRIGMREDSAAQRPEKLYKERALFAYVLFLTLFMALLLVVDIPALQRFVESYSPHRR
jgi:4-hydroxybenzoate polyprenyltransferase